MAQSISGQRANLADLDPGGLGQEFFRERVGQWEAGPLRLARDAKREDRAGMAIEHLMAQHQYRTPTGLLPAFRWLQGGPVDIAP